MHINIPWWKGMLYELPLYLVRLVGWTMFIGRLVCHMIGKFLIYSLKRDYASASIDSRCLFMSSWWTQRDTWIKFLPLLIYIELVGQIWIICGRWLKSSMFIQHASWEGVQSNFGNNCYIGSLDQTLGSLVRLYLFAHCSD